MIKLYAPKDEMDLALVRSLLDAGGITYHVANEHMAALNTAYAMGAHARMIWVLEEDLDAAMAILTEAFGPQPQAPRAEAGYPFWDKVKAVLGTIFFARPFPVRKSRQEKNEPGD